MRQIDRLVVRELFGPWLFGVGLFAALLMAATYLGRITGYIVDGVPISDVLTLVGLLMPALLVKTFSMAVLLAALLAFGRLSSDSEITALRAAGAGLPRIVAPVAGFSLVIALVSFAFNEALVPAATARSGRLLAEIAQRTQVKAAQPVAYPQILDGKLRAYIVAQDLNAARQALRGVTVVAYSVAGQEEYLLFAKELEFRGPNDWRIRGGARIVSADLQSDIRIQGDAWPEDLVPKVRATFAEIATQRSDDFDARTMAELGGQIARAKQERSQLPATIANWEYGYWNKLSVPLAAFVFGTLGAVLGIRNHRTGTATGFALAIAIIFAYVTLANFMNVWAMGGVIPAYVASFAPLAIGLVVSGVAMWRRNV